MTIESLVLDSDDAGPDLPGFARPRDFRRAARRLARLAKLTENCEQANEYLLCAKFLNEAALALRVMAACEDTAITTLTAVRAEADAALAEVARLDAARLREGETVEQVLGRALGYPDHCHVVTNDLNWVCVGPHTPVTLADEAAGRIAKLTAERDTANRMLDALVGAHVSHCNSGSGSPLGWRASRPDCGGWIGYFASREDAEVAVRGWVRGLSEGRDV